MMVEGDHMFDENPEGQKIIEANKQRRQTKLTKMKSVDPVKV